MNNPSILASLQSRGLRAWQASFAASFLETDSAAFHLLAAPPGTGKAQTSIAIAAELAKPEVTRMLVLAPSVLCEEWRERLHKELSGIPVVLVTRQVFREIEATLPIGVSPWTARGIYVISQDLAKHSDFVAGLSEVTWDLVIVDDAHRLASKQRATLLDRLMVKSFSRRLLLLSATPLPALQPWLHPSPDHAARFPSRINVTNWFGVLKNWDGSTVESARFNWRIISYTRGADEVECWSRLLILMKDLEIASGGNQNLIELLTRRACSTLFACEQSLLRLGHFLRLGTERTKFVLPNASAAQLEIPSFPEDLNPVAQNEPFQWVDKAAGLMIVDQCLRTFEMISIDEKLNVLKLLIRSIVDLGHDGIPRICVFSVYVDTVSYLHTAVDDIRLPLYKLTGANSFSERQTTVERFLRDGGLIIVTDAALSEGIVMPQVDHVIHYDLPHDPQDVDQRFRPFDRFGRNTPLEMYLFRDESGVLSPDAMVFETLREKLKLLHEIDIDVVSRTIESYFSHPPFEWV